MNWLDIGAPAAGGAEVHLFEILRRFAARGHRVTWLAAGFAGLPAEEERDGIRIVRRGAWWNANHTLPAAYRREFAGERFDCVLEDINKLPFLAPRWADAPVLAIVPHLFGTTVFAETAWPQGLYVLAHEALIPLVYGRTPFVAISESTRADLVARGLPAANVSVVHCGLDHARYRPTAPKADRPSVVFLGRLRRYKGVDVLLDAFARVVRTRPDAILDIVGDGPYKGALEAQARRLGLGGVRFRGFVPAEEKVALLSAAHVAVCPSPKEGWGLTVVEANACGTAVVASRSPGLVDSVKDGVTGLLVPHGDVPALAEAIGRVLDDAPLRTRLEAEGRTWAATFTWDRCADEMHGALERVLSAAPARAPRTAARAAMAAF